MKQVEFEITGDPQKVLQVRERPIPHVKDGEIRVRVKACPINPSDEMFVRGQYKWKPEFPQVAGLEGAGVVDAVGSGVMMEVGTPVFFRMKGTWAEYVTGPVSQFSQAPLGVSFDVLCQLSLNPATAWALLHEADLSAGKWLLLTGGASSVNRLIIQMASKRSIKTICLTRKADSGEILRSLGADLVIQVPSDGVVDRVMTITGTHGVHACFDSVGGSLGDTLCKCMTNGGTVYVFGRMAAENDLIFNNAITIFRHLTIKGFGIDNWLMQIAGTVKRRMHAEIADMAASNQLPLTPWVKHPLTEIVAAIRDSVSVQARGKVLLVMG